MPFFGVAPGRSVSSAGVRRVGVKVSASHKLHRCRRTRGRATSRMHKWPPAAGGPN